MGSKSVADEAPKQNSEREFWVAVHERVSESMLVVTGTDSGDQPELS